MARRILVIDDNKDAAAAVGSILELSGHTVFLSFDGAHALEVAAEEQPDVLLLDIGMPGLNGHQICRRIRAEPWGKYALVVAITGWTRDRDRGEAMESGCDEYLVKPVSSELLLDVVERRRPS